MTNAAATKAIYTSDSKSQSASSTPPQGFGIWCDYGEFMALPADMFPQLTYKDEPVEVEIIIKTKED